MRVLNRYLSAGVSSNPLGASSFGTISRIGGESPLITPGSRARTRTEVAEFIEEFGKVNLPFESGASGRLQPGDRPKIQRGFVRRANRNAANPLSGMSLRFMYNPTQIQRNYATYLDQAAIDPFNTIFQSGNLVAPPSIVEFTFSLFFDRQDEATTRGPWTPKADWPKLGVLHDFAFFDAVLRNVPPSGTPNTLPDNGVMMVNPEDVTVVFSKDLTVQGRPTNSTVRFTKFTHKMVPTRMEIDITLIINYFGPLREPFGLDAKQQIGQYQALIPYDTTIGDGLANTRSVEEAVRAWKSSGSAVDLLQAGINTSVSQPTTWWDDIPSGTSDGGVAPTIGMVFPVNATLKLKALEAAGVLVSLGGGPQYSQAQRTKHGAGVATPWKFDCSSFVWRAYKEAGGAGVFGRGKYPPTAAMLDFFNSSGWTTVQRVLHWSSAGGIAEKLMLIAEPGDILFERKGGNGHIALVVNVDRAHNRLQTIAARSSNSTPQVGVAYEGAAHCAGKYNYLLRPTLAGAQSIGGGL